MANRVAAFQRHVVQKYSLVPPRCLVAMEIGILINAETEEPPWRFRAAGSSSAPNRTILHRDLLTGTASEGQRQACGGWSRPQSNAQGSLHKSPVPVAGGL